MKHAQNMPLVVKLQEQELNFSMVDVTLCFILKDFTFSEGRWAY